MANDYISQVTLPNNITYDINDVTKLPLAGGTLTGNTFFNSSTGSKKFYITRLGNTVESAGMWQDDSYFHIDVTNDETTANIQFKLYATDTEGSDGSRAQTSYVTFGGSSGKSTVTADYFTGLASKATADVDGNAIKTTYAKLASPALTGTPTAPTADPGTNTTQIATTAFVNNTLASVNAMQFKGTLGTGGTITALPATHGAGDTYRVITAGTWAGKYCEVGTLIICVKDGTTTADADWTSVETNEDGAVIGPASSTSDALVRFSGQTGRIIKSNSYTTMDDNGHITITHKSGSDGEVRVKYSSTIDFAFMVGSGDANHGIYDYKKSAWILFAEADNNWSFAGNASTATTLASSKTLWGQSFNGSANVTGSMTNVGPSMKLPANQTTFQFLTSGGGAANGQFGRLSLYSTYANADLTNYVLDVGGKVRIKLPSTATNSKEFIITGSNNNYISLHTSGIQAYNSSGNASLFYLQYYGGNLQIGSSDYSASATRDLYGQFDFKSSTGFNFSGMGAASDTVARNVWFSYNGQRGTPVYDDDFKYNPSTNALTIGNLTVTGGTTDSTISSSGSLTLSSANSKTITISSGYTLYFNSASGTSIIFQKAGTEIARFDTSGHFVQKSGSSYQLGTSSIPWTAVYATSFYGSGANITLGTASVAVVTDANKKLSTQDLSVTDSNASTNATTTFVQAVTQSATGKISVTKASLNTSGTWSGTASKATTTANTSDSLYLVGVKSGATSTLLHDSSITIKDTMLSTTGIIQTGRYFHNVASFGCSNTPKEILIKTKIPFANGTTMPKIILHMYTYATGLPTEIGIVFYIYGGEFCNMGVTSNTNHRPKVTLCTYTESNTKYVAIGLGLSNVAADNLPNSYYIRFNVDFIDIWWPTDNTRIAHAKGWTITGNTETTSIIPTDDRKNPSYVDQAQTAKQAAFTSTKWGIAYYSDAAGTFASTGTGTSGQYLKSNGSSAPTWATFEPATVGLGNVENTKLSTWAGSSNISTVGTITSGIWQSTTAIGTAYGGTGNTSYTENRLVWTESATKFTAGYHYADSSHIGIYYTSQPSYNLYVNGTIGTNNKITLTGTDSTTAAIAFSRTGSYNYITVPADGSLALGKGQSSADTWIRLISTSLQPERTNEIDLGTDSVRWKNLYTAGNISIGATGNKIIEYKGTKATKAMITFIDNTSDANGNGIKIGGGALTVVGAGESAANLSKGVTEENLYLLADSTVYMYANADTIGNRIGFKIDTSGNVIPQKAEAVNSNAQTLGASGNVWKAVYATDFYGSGSNITLGTASVAVVTDANKKLTTRSITNNTSATAVTASTNLITANTLYYHTGNSNIVTVGTITSGEWKSTTAAIGTAYGGTGNTSYTANRLVWTESATKFTATNHYASTTKIAINSTNEPTETLYVNGNTRIKGDLTIEETNTTNHTGGNLLPNADNTQTLGDSSHRWASLSIGTATTYGGAATETISNVARSGIQFIYWNDGPTVSTGDLGADDQFIFAKNGKLFSSALTLGSSTTPVYFSNGVVTAFNTNIGDPYQMVYVNGGAITAATPTQVIKFEFSNGHKKAIITDANSIRIINADTKIIQCVITEGFQYINAPFTYSISSTASNSQIQIITSIAVSGHVEGYITLARGSEFTGSTTIPVTLTNATA